MMIQQLRALVFAVVTALALVADAGAQGTRATIAGTVKDTRGIALPRVTVTIRNIESEADRPAVTAPDGTFSVGGLVPGRYRVSIQEPGVVPFAREVTVLAGARADLDIVLSYTVPDFVPVPDRWRLKFPEWIRYQNQDGEYPFVRESRLRSVRSERPEGRLARHRRRHLHGVDGDLRDAARIPRRCRRRPASAPSRRSSEQFFGNGSQYAALPSAIFSFELFKGNTAFKPRDWAFRITPQFNLNYVHLRERNAVNATPEAGATRRTPASGAAGSVCRSEARRRRPELRLRLGARRAFSRSIPTSAASCSATPTSACGRSATGDRTAISGTSPISISSKRKPTAS